MHPYVILGIICLLSLIAGFIAKQPNQAERNLKNLGLEGARIRRRLEHYSVVTLKD